MAPKDEGEMRDMILTAVEHPGPAAIRYPRGSGFGVDISGAPKKIEIGKAEIVRTGGDAAIIAYGSMVNPSLDAATRLASERIETTVVNARFVKPLDSEAIIKLATEHRLIITVEEAYLAGGFGSAVMELLEDHGLLEDVSLVRMGVPDEIVTHGDAKFLLGSYGLDADGIFNKVKEGLSLLTDQQSGNRLRAVK